MKSRKWFLLFLVVTVSAFILAACGGSDEPSTANDNGNNAENQTNDDGNENEAPENEPEETYDLGGRHITINFHADLTPQEGTEIGDLQVERWREVEEKYNVTIEWTTTPYDEKFDHFTTTVLAGEPYADIVLFDDTETGRLSRLALEGLIVAYDDIIDLSQTKLSDMILEQGRILPDGKVYAVETLGTFARGGGMFYNKTLFEQAGLEDPYDLVQRGEWTWDAMLHAAKTLTSGDQYGLALNPHTIAEYSIISNDARVLDIETGEIVLDSPEALQALEFTADLFNLHDVVRENDRSTLWEDPPVFFNEGIAAMVHGATWEASEERREAPFEWGYVYWPLGPNASEYGAIRTGVSGYVIPVGVEDPEIVYQIWEDLQLWEYERDQQIAWFEDIFPNEESVEMATQMLDNVKFGRWKPYNLADAFYGTWEAIAFGEQTPAQAVASIKPEAQARVDEFLGTASE